MLGFLITHEMMVGENTSKKKKCIALRATTESEKELDIEDTVLLIRKFKSFFNKNIKQEKVKEAIKRAPNLFCFKCRKPGHIKAECPLLSKYKIRKKKVMCAYRMRSTIVKARKSPKKKKNPLVYGIINKVTTLNSKFVNALMKLICLHLIVVT